MKLLIAGDIHGSAHWAKELQKLYEKHQPDRLVLTGDLLYHGPRNPLPKEYDPAAVADILNELAPHITAVQGNCDSEVDQMMLSFPIMAKSALLYVDGTAMQLTHGHVYNEENPPLMAEGDVLICGHSHKGKLKKYKRFICANPGSLSLPKDGRHSYLVFEDGVFSLYEHGKTEPVERLSVQD